MFETPSVIMCLLFRLKTVPFVEHLLTFHRDCDGRKPMKGRKINCFCFRNVMEKVGETWRHLCDS